MALLTIDDVEGRQVHQFALRTNVEKLKELEDRRHKIVWEEFEFEGRANKVTYGLYNKVLFLLAFTGGISIYLTTKIPSASAFVISAMLICLFLAGTYIYISMAKSSITSMHRFIIMNITERLRKLSVEARVLMELEENRKRGQATNVVDNDEDPLVDMDSFIHRTKYICDATDFSDFKKVHYRFINVSWVMAGIYFPLVLFMLYCNFYYVAGKDSSPPHLSSLVGGHAYEPTGISIGRKYMKRWSFDV